jgi:serine phosphatase RsbU (regulator of sigma subunit)
LRGNLDNQGCMNRNEIDSKSFHDATLRSDRFRIIAILAVLGLLAFLTVFRILVFRWHEAGSTLGPAVAFFGAAIIYEFLMLGRVNRAIKAGSDLQPAIWIVNILVETLFPTLGLVLVIALGMAGPYQALVAPIVLTYFIFVALSTLKLSPMLATLAGIFSAAGYGMVALGVHVLYAAPELRSAMQPVEMYVGNATVLLASGLVAGAVARQIRDHVAAALREARQVERMTGELETARSIQQGLLPKETPELGDFQIAGWNKPADQTGGDYYDWFRLQDGRTAFTLADVTGHGVSSALVASACHAYSRASMGLDSDLAAIVTRVNRLLCADLPPGRLVTMVAGALDPATGRVELLSAGHAPLLLYTAHDDQVSSFEAHGVPFGVFGGMAYGPPQEIVLGPGDVLVLVTDGFFEWTNERDEDFGFERLHAAIRAARDYPPDWLIAHLHEAVTTFTGGTPQSDDLTAVVLRRRAPVFRS